MVWCGGFDGGAAGGGQSDHGPSGIVGAVFPRDEAALFHPAELVGDSAAVPSNQTAEVPGSDEAIGYLGERYQQGVVGAGEPGVAHELAVEGVSQLALQVAVGLPEVRFPFVEPAGFGQRRSLVGSEAQDDLASGMPGGELVVGVAHALERIHGLDRNRQLAGGDEAGQLLPHRR
jgi:hypothetical protein